MADEKKQKITPKLKPELSAETKQSLTLRRVIQRRRPAFRRQEWFRYKKLGRSGWRTPDGMHSKIRQHLNYRPTIVSIGFRGPADVRGLHPSGFDEVRVMNVGDLDRIDPKKQAARVGGTVGAKKREAIEKEAAKRTIRVLNPMHRGADEK